MTSGWSLYQGRQPPVPAPIADGRGYRFELTLERLQRMANPSIELLLAWHNATQRNNHNQ
jgi:hypothetical protein